MRPRLVFASACVVLALAAACGGSSDQTDAAGTSGAAQAGASGASAGKGGGPSAGTAGAATGGAAGIAGTATAGSTTAGSASSTTAGSAGSTTALCPPSLPQPSTACAQEGTTCSYGGCCPSQATCTGGTWKVSSAGCAPPTQCPAAEPMDGEACDPCLNGSCSYDKCDKPMQSNKQAVCLSTGVWQVTPVSCATVKCGTTTCPAGLVCLQYKLGGPANTTSGCAMNPCAPEAVSCACAGPTFCKGFLCTEPGQDTIVCTDKQEP